MVEELFEALHRPSMGCTDDLETWMSSYRQRPMRPPRHDAVYGGLQAGTIGLAFLSGYQAALRELVPSLSRTALVALAASETAGAHPKAMETLLLDGRLVGRKAYVTLGTRAERLLVVARRSTTERNLVVVEIDARTPGVRLTTLPPTPFVPDVPHAALEVDCSIEGHEVRDGDGYTSYLKPFRTIEDLHVLLALLAHASATARSSAADRSLREQLSATVASLLGLMDLPPLSPALHLALGGVLPQARELMSRVGDHLRVVRHQRAEAWARDLPLLGIATGVRQKRLERAWEAFA